MEQILLILPSLLGLDPGTFALLVGIIVLVSNVTSKVIPESATGTLGVLRKVAAVLGAAASNRITPNVSSKDISKAIAAGIPDSTVRQAADQLPEAVETGRGTNAFAEAIVESVQPTIGPGPFEPQGE